MRNLFKTLPLAFAALTVAAMLAPNLGPSEARAGQADASSPVRILAFGDSLTQGFGVPPGMDFPSRLERALKTRNLAVSVINAGLSGDTSAGGLARLDWSLGDAANR